MPELPEVETTRRGVEPHVVGCEVTAVRVREPRLRWPVSEELGQALTGRRIEAVDRRAKYLLFVTGAGRMMVHLGMSGSLRVLPLSTPHETHDHVDIELDGGRVLRYRDPRRFGSIFWLPEAASHPLLEGLGPEPFDETLTGAFLHAKARGRKAAVKTFIMDSHIVVGVGNIYANEALFDAGIAPGRPAGRISLPRYERLAFAIRGVLARAIDAGGTTLRDFVHEDGSPGYFRADLKVYGRGGEPCRRCGRPLRETRLGQRTTVHCGACQR